MSDTPRTESLLAAARGIGDRISEATEDMIRHMERDLIAVDAGYERIEKGYDLLVNSFSDASNRAQAEHDWGVDGWVLVNQLRERMEVPYEPHQSVQDRMLEAAARVPYAVTATEALKDVKEAIANGLKFDGAKWLLFESGRDRLLDMIDAALAKNPAPAPVPEGTFVDMPDGERMVAIGPCEGEEDDERHETCTKPTHIPPIVAEARRFAVQVSDPQAARAVNSLADEIIRLRERLEIGYAFNMKGERIACDNDEYDGIYCRDETIKMLEDSRHQSGTQVPEGWKLVPLEPTEAQLKAIDGYIGHWTGNFSHDREGNALAYKAMLEAAPSKEPPMLPTRESERAKVVAQVGECCRGADPACTGGCLVERALRPQKGPPPGPPDPPKPPWHDPKG